MSTAVQTGFGTPLPSGRGLQRALSWSFGVHVGLVLLMFLVPRAWFAKRPDAPMMTISLGGSPGPKSTGTTSIGGKAVEQVAPPPKRPEPERPTPKADPAPVPVKATPVAPAPKTLEMAKPEVPAARPVSTGQQIVAGNTAIDTGAHGQGPGLTSGQGGTGGEDDLKNFCCPDYLTQLTNTIGGNWQKNQPEKGLTVLKFTIRKDGTIDLANMVMEQGSGSGVLDRAAKGAVIASQNRLPALPKEYPRDTLTVHMKFPYGL